MPTPEIRFKVVVWDEDIRRLRYFSTEDAVVLLGTIIQISTDAGNALNYGTDGGLLVSGGGSIPVETGSVTSPSGTGASYSIPVVFTNTYGAAPFIRLTIEYSAGVLPIARVASVTTTGFNLHLDEVTGVNLDATTVYWATN